MGVQGLTSLVDQNPHLLTDYQLHGTKVVIDGNNLFHFLYYYFTVEIKFGGDYDTFAKHVSYYFSTLKACEVTPYVVFDGAYEKDDRKLPTTLKRAQERLHLAGFLSCGEKRARVLPILAYETFRSVLNELGVSHVTCDCEADDQIAALANHWGCPVMSNDSDFFVYDLKGGFILFDYLNLHLRKSDPSNGEPHHYLEVQIYYFDTLLGLFKDMDRKLIPLFATLLGNDIIDAQQFDSFFASVKLPTATTKRLVTHTRQSKMISVLKWLESAHSFDIALDKIMSHIKKDKREQLKALVHRSVETYANPSSNLHQYFEQQDAKLKCRSRLKTKGGNVLPYWFVTGVRKGDVSVLAVNAIVLHRVILLAQVEVMTYPSAYLCDLPIRQVMYGILLSLDIQLTKGPVNKDIATKKTVQEYDRDQKNQKKCSICPLYELNENVKVPHLQQIPHMSIQERKVFLLETLQTSEELLKGLPHDLHIPVCSVLYWVRHSNPKVSSFHFSALLVCILKLSVVDVLKKRAEFIGDLGLSPDNEDGDYPVMAKVAKIDYVQKGSADLRAQDHSEKCSEGHTHIVDGNVTCAAENDGVQEAEIAAVVDEGGDAEHNAKGLLTTVGCKCTAEEINTAYENLAKFVKSPTHNNVSQFEGNIIHAFSQFQACYRSVLYLNQLLLSPLSYVSPASVYNGTFVYNLCKELRARKHPHLYIQELLVRSSFLCGYYQQIHATLSQQLQDDAFNQPPPGVAHKAKKKSKKGKNSGKSRGHTDEKPITREAGDKSFVASCELLNRFDGLHVEYGLEKED